MQATLDRLRERRAQGAAEGGFTLIELLIVIVILGILAGIVVFAVQNLTGSSAKASCGSDFKTVQTAVEAYKAQVGTYPGGAVASGWNLNPAPNTSVATGYPPTGTAAVEALLGTATDPDGNSDGPWLKDTPYNSGRYAVIVLNDSTGTVQVTDGAGNVVADCSAIG
jgi:general secretion pathway protein G